MLNGDLESVVLRGVEDVFVHGFPGGAVGGVDRSHRLDYRHYQNLHPLEVGLVFEGRLDGGRGVEFFPVYFHAVLSHRFGDAHLHQFAVLPERNLRQVQHGDDYGVVPSRGEPGVVRDGDALAVRRYHVGEYRCQDEDGENRHRDYGPASEEVPDFPHAGPLRADLLREVNGYVCLCHELTLHCVHCG